MFLELAVAHLPEKNRPMKQDPHKGIHNFERMSKIEHVCKLRGFRMQCVRILGRLRGLRFDDVGFQLS